ncbi:MAG: SpoIIE family protein phosphatase [Planctomycetia bacterium]|nr:SpoIIE family protein phosphatase [Planctomycetia bacterium]
MRLRIFLTVFLPLFVIFTPLSYFYYESQMKMYKEDAIATCRGEIYELANSMVQNANLLSRNVDVSARLLTLKEDFNVMALFRQTMEESERVQALVVAYDPNFLSKVRNGEYPDYTFVTDSDLAPLTTVPNHYAPGIYRKSDNTLYGVDNIGDYYETRDAFLTPKLSMRGTWTDPFKGHVTGNRIISYGCPFFWNGEFAGVVLCLVRVKDLFDLSLLQQYQQRHSQGSDIFVLSESGTLLYDSSSNDWPHYSLYAIAAQKKLENYYPIIDKAIADSLGTYELRGLLDEAGYGKSLYAFAKTQDDNCWTVVGKFQEASLLGEARRSLQFLIAAAFLCAFGICVVIFVLLLRSTSPIEAMTRVASQVANGNLNCTVPERYEHRGGSVGALVRSYNTMVSNLQKHIESEVHETITRSHLEQELLIGEELQRTFLPANRTRFFPDKGYIISGDLIPAKYVAGDFLDFWRVTENQIGLVIGDVSGKGIAAAMVMVATSTLIRQAAGKEATPGNVVSEVNWVLRKRNKKNMFVTLFLAFYNPETGLVRYCNAGHNQPALLKENGEVKFLPYAENCVMGIMSGIKYETCEIHLNPGETLFLYTDGVTDATAPDGEQFGQKRLKKLLSYLAKTPPEKLIGYIQQAVCNFQGAVPTDDMTMLMLKRTDETDLCWTRYVAIDTMYGKETPFIEEVTEELRNRQWNDRDIFAVELALNEGIHNAMEHGNMLDASKKVRIGVCISNTAISVSIRDEGEGFVEGQVPDPREEDRVSIPTGRGILLIRGFMTHVWFNEACNEIFMTKEKSVDPLTAS